ncbi:MAG: serine hydrolase domain-containing protein [Sandaracinus sp.]
MARPSAALALGPLAIVALGCGASPAPRAPGAPEPVVDAASLDAWADRELARVPSAVVGLVVGDEIVWRRGVGASDARGGPPPDPAIAMYRIGSITKVLSALALLQLVDAGALSLDDPLTRWVPELGAHAGAVTLRHLLTHTSGIPSGGDRSAPYWTSTPPTEEAMLRALDVPLELEPGTRASYSNGAMALVGVVVARAAHQSFRSYVREHVLGPLGMHAVWDREDVPPGALAIGVAPNGEPDPPHWQLGAFEAAGGLYASLDDLAAVARVAFGDAPSVLSARGVAAWTTDDPLPGDHAAAWVASEVDGLPVVSHAGSTSDYSASLVVFPTRRIAAVVLTSGPDDDLPSCIARALARAAMSGEAPTSCVPPPLDPATLRDADALLARARAWMAAPTEEPATEIFSAGFLAGTPQAAIDEVLATVRERYGRCDAHEITGPGGLGMHAILQCERGRLAAELHLDAGEPRRIDAFLLPGL